MPTYSVKCTKCGKVFDSMSTIAKRNDPVECECGEQATRDVESELNSCGRFDETMVNHERWSYALGVHPDQIPEAMKAHPGAVFNDKGQMLIKNRKEKLQRMAEADMFEID